MHKTGNTYLEDSILKCDDWEWQILMYWIPCTSKWSNR